jgi:putative acyl-CoA dehydrogenase
MDWTTHEVFNQVPVLEDYNLLLADPALREAVKREGAGWHGAVLAAWGATLGRGATLRLGAEANRHPPQLVSFDPQGRRVDRVDFHPAWHQLMALLWGEGVHCSAWAAPRAGAQVARAAAFFLHGQVEAGSLCPTTMTFAAIPLLAEEPALWAALGAQLLSRRYDPRDLPAADKAGLVIGMGMTEKQGGSDLRAVTTTARPLGAEGEYSLVGHKWFYSVPSADAHLVLAREAEELSCFFVPRWRPDGGRNGVRIQRLKDKLGNRSNASGEVEFQEAWGRRLGAPGRGLALLLRMATHTRLDCVLGSAALLRQALVQALHHVRHRRAFGRPLVEQPLMQAVLADLALESEAATVLALRLARAFEAPTVPLERALIRVLLPAAKLWVCKRAVAACGECLEVWGGNGYVEEGPMPRLYREAPVNAIWEGASNVMGLDLLRAVSREPEAAKALFGWLLEGAAGESRRLRLAARRLARDLGSASDQATEQRTGGNQVAGARDLAARLVLLAQALLLCQAAPPAVAAAFIASRIPNGPPALFGARAVAGPAAILERAWEA